MSGFSQAADDKGESIRERDEQAEERSLRREMHEEVWALRHSTEPGLPAPDDGGF